MRNLYVNNTTQHNGFKTMVHLNVPDLWLFNLRGTCTIATENKGLQYLFWQIPYKYHGWTCGVWEFSTTHREKRKDRLWSPFLISHSWDSIYWIMMVLGLQGRMLLWNAVPNSVAGYRKPSAPPLRMFKGCKRKPGEHKPLRRGWVSAWASFPFLWAQFWASEVNYLQVHFSCTQGNGFPTRVLQV